MLNYSQKLALLAKNRKKAEELSKELHSIRKEVLLLQKELDTRFNSREFYEDYNRIRKGGKIIITIEI